METPVTQRITATIGLVVALVCASVAVSQARLTRWAADTRHHGDVVEKVIMIAGLAVLAIAAVAFLQGKVWEHLNLIQ